ncbi:MAG: SDR family NAD(P)-dependent oxidoreductase, partial [Gammaproteobacteria bacterium]|nr:SDR family NAD(P)-dependent oxidoreductase [Gammaproteobacteria bacterium]
LAAIVKRHPALRAGFRLDSGEWVQSFFDADAVDANPELAAPVDFFDGKQLPENVRQEKIKKLITETSRALRIDKPPLWRVFIMAESDTCYSIVTIGHHMINDLLGSDVLFKETWQAYEQLSKGEKINLGAQVPSYKDFLDSLSLLGESGQASALGFWKSKFPSREYHFSIPIDHRLGANIEAAEASETLSLTKARTLMLQKLKQSHDCSLYMLLLAPLYLLMSEWSRQSWVVLSHRMHGRDLGPGNQDTQAFKQHYFSSVGNFAVNYPVGISIDSSDWADIIRHLKAFFAEIPLNGISFDWVGEHLPSYCYPDNNLTPVRVNFLGNRSFPPSSVFEFSAAEVGQRYALPEQARISLIEVIFTIVDDQVRIEWSYSKNFHKAATIQALSTRYLELMQFLLEGQLPAPAIEQPSVTQFSEWQKPLFGKTAIVTGASRGIGRHIALKLAEQGARVVLAARSKNGLDSTYNEIRQNGGEALVMATDICELDQVEAMVRQVKRWSGRIDILVNNAGLTGLASLRESDPRQWKHIIEVNLFGAYYCCRSVLPAMTEQNSGKIVNIGSDSSHIGYPLFSAYAAAKHGLLGLSKSLAEEVKNHNIQVNTVCPSAVGNQGGDHHPVRSGVTADNVADTVLFLVTKDADSITGQHINIFGQQDMYWFGSEKMTALQKMFG